MLPKSVLLAALFVDALLLLDLLTGLVFTSWFVWFTLHCLCSVLAAMMFSLLAGDRASTLELQNQQPVDGCILNALDQECTDSDHSSFPSINGRSSGAFMLAGLIVLFIPGVGGLGLLLSLWYASYLYSRQRQEPVFWQVTRLEDLPFTTPAGRKINEADSRGFTEHILYSSDDNDIYRKVLAAADIRASFAVDSLRQAMRHKDERIRLTACKSLDSKVSGLHQAIRELQLQLRDCAADQRSDIWLQIASNYWELITLEGGEPVAREKLLANACDAAIEAVSALSTNRNAHYLLGRVLLAQGCTQRAQVALKHAQTLGMPSDKIVPYLAECAFVDQDFFKVEQLLGRLDSSIVSYPPLLQVARFWA